MRSTIDILPENLLLLRQIRGLTQKTLAQLSGCSKNHISAIERGMKFPSAKMIEKCSEALKIKPFILFVDLSELDLRNRVSGIIQNSSQVAED